MKKVFFHSRTLRGLGCRLLTRSNGGHQGTYRDTGYANRITYALPRPVAEWALEEVSINQDTAIVSVFLHSTVAITVTLDGNQPTRRDDTAIPVLNYVFAVVPAGQHSIYFSDVKATWRPPQCWWTGPNPSRVLLLNGAGRPRSQSSG